MDNIAEQSARQADMVRRIALGDMIHRSAAKFGERKALLDGASSITFSELDEWSSRFAHHLLRSDLQRGDKVAMICANSVQFMVAAFGILKAGMVWVPLNTGLPPADMRYILDHAEARMVVVDAALQGQPALGAMLDAAGLPLLRCAYGGLAGPIPSEFVAACQSMPASLPEVPMAEQDLALIMYTSGTTGRPKGAMHTHLSVHAALMSNIATIGLREDDATSAVLPLFHCAQFALAGAALAAGASVVLLRGFDPTALLDALARERVTVMAGLPIMYGALLQHPGRPQRDLSALRLCVYAMAPMPKPLLERLIAELCPNFALGSGQTEAFPMTMYFAPSQQLRRFGNYWGQPCPVNELAIMDEEGKLLGRGQLGEIVHRGPNVMLGYYKDPEATAATRRHGWHHTGDLGMLDEDGQLLFKDRMKDMIKTGGENVASVKVEEVLLRHQAVASAAVVGLPHPRWTEAVAAFVVLKPGAAAEAEALRAFCQEQLAGFEVPKHITVLEQLPMTSTGKIQKHVLRSAHQQLFGA